MELTFKLKLVKLHNIYFFTMYMKQFLTANTLVVSNDIFHKKFKNIFSPVFDDTLLFSIMT